MAKTQYSFSADPTRRGAPDGHVLPVRDVRLSAGAGFVVAICGNVMTMPGLPRRPAAEVDPPGRRGAHRRLVLSRAGAAPHATVHALPAPVTRKGVPGHGALPPGIG